jgi:glucuronokinase
MIVRQRAYARAGFIGNPSDGYHGKTIAFTIGDFWAEVVLYESPELELRPGAQDLHVFASMDDLLANVQRTGYYGGVRLLKAGTKKFAEYCRSNGIGVPERNFTMRYSTTVPRQVGLGGSSAIITAVMRALMQFYEVDIADEELPNVVLAAETEELGLTAGLQDRVVQAYGGVVYMDFDKDYMGRHGHGRYERLSVKDLPPVYVAYRTELAEESSVAHIAVHERYARGETIVVETMSEIAGLADLARELMEQHRWDELAEVLDRNFDLRCRIFPIREADKRMVSLARSTGASCKFCGSGGAVVGTYRDEGMLARLRAAMEGAGYEFAVPSVGINGPAEG